MAKKGFTQADLDRMGMVEVEKGVFKRESLLETGELKRDEIQLNGGSIIKFVRHPLFEEKALDEFTFLGKLSKPLAIFDIEPMGAPRMTRSDTWKLDPNHKDPKRRQRKPVTRYFRFRSDITAQAQKQGFIMPSNGFHVIFILPMPHSWSEKKKNQMNCTPHQQKPDCDNMVKAVKDSLCKEDAHIWDYRITKYWGKAGRILIYPL